MTSAASPLHRLAPQPHLNRPSVTAGSATNAVPYTPRMAQKVITIYTDDLTGEETEEAQTHTIAIDGIAYEIDLGPDSYDKLMEAVGPFLTNGRKASRAGKAAKSRSAGSSASGDTAKIRAWAKENGYEVNERGRVPADIREAYEKAL